jgi:hypothetical protein
MKLNNQKKATNEILTQHVEADKVKTELTKKNIQHGKNDRMIVFW